MLEALTGALADMDLPLGLEVGLDPTPAALEVGLTFSHKDGTVRHWWGTLGRDEGRPAVIWTCIGESGTWIVIASLGNGGRMYARHAGDAPVREVEADVEPLAALSEVALRAVLAAQPSLPVFGPGMSLEDALGKRRRRPDP